MIAQVASLRQQVGELDRCIQAQHRANGVSRRLETIPSIGAIGATAIAATITDPKSFKSGRDLAAWIGLVPRQHSTGGKDRLGGISKQGDRYLRRLLVIGATAVVQHARRRPETSVDCVIIDAVDGSSQRRVSAKKRVADEAS